jgi:hypothetical protein
MAVAGTMKLPRGAPIFSRAARAYMRKVMADPKLGNELLRKAGIITRSGRLARPYRLQPWEREIMAELAAKER